LGLFLLSFFTTSKITFRRITSICYAFRRNQTGAKGVGTTSPKPPYLLKAIIMAVVNVDGVVTAPIFSKMLARKEGHHDSFIELPEGL